MASQLKASVFALVDMGFLCLEMGLEIGLNGA
jgi:hypothetical protein